MKKPNQSALKGKSSSKFTGSKKDMKSGAKKVKLNEEIPNDEWKIWSPAKKYCFWMLEIYKEYISK